MIRHSVFATNIFVEDDFIDKSISSDMKQYIEQMWTTRAYDNNWQTEPDLHTKPAFEKFAEKVIQKSKEQIELLDYDVEDIKITDMWGNVLRNKESQL